MKLKNPNKQNVNLLCDMSNLFYRTAYYLQPELVTMGYRDWSLWKHKVLEVLFDFKTKFSDWDTTMYLCYDDKKTTGKYWRHEHFPHYKENRKKMTSPIPKDILFEQFDILYNELKENVPWKTIKVPRCEADDIIGTITINERDSINAILSPDKDFQQLQSYDDVVQWCPSKRTWLETDDPERFIFDHLLRGDSGDNIPNYLSDSDTLSNPAKRQKRLTSKKLDELWELYEKSDMITVVTAKFNESEKKRFKENRLMIDLRMLPKDIKEGITNEYKTVNVLGNDTRFTDFCHKNGLRNILETSLRLL